MAFLFNAVEYLGHVGEGLTNSGFSVGEALTARLPGSARDIRVVAPDGVEHDVVSPDPSALSWGPIRRSGLHLITWEDDETADRQTRGVAVNLLDENEARLATIETAEELGIGTGSG